MLATLLTLAGLLVVLRLAARGAQRAFALLWRPGKDLKGAYGKWAVVTGATDGIGRAMARELARQGLGVVLVSRSQARLDEAAKEIGEGEGVEVRTVAVDFARLGEGEARVREALEGLDVGVLVNNVGMSYDHPMPYTELPAEKERALVALNVDSLLFMTRLVLPGMESRRRGAIVNISSGSARFPSPLLTHYAATKSFVELFSRSLAPEVAPKGIHVQVQSPLYVTTKLAKKRHATWDTPSPAAYAKAAVRQIGYETATSPWWAHALLIWLMTDVLPEGVVDRIVYGMHLGIYKKALAKKEKEAKSN